MSNMHPRRGNSWGLDTTMDGEVLYTQPTTGNPLVHVILPESILAEGKLPGLSGTMAFFPVNAPIPLWSGNSKPTFKSTKLVDTLPEQAPSFMRRELGQKNGITAISLQNPPSNIIGHFFMERDGVTFKASKQANREKTEFITSTNLWFRPHRGHGWTGWSHVSGRFL